MKFLAVCFTVLLVTAALWQDVHSAQDLLKGRNDLPIQIKSNELTTDGSGKIATFNGSVTVKQGDVTIFCDRLVVRYGDQDREVSKVEASGNVRILQGNRVGTAEHAVFDRQSETIVLEGNPRVSQGDDVVTGKVITFYLNDQKSVVSGDADTRVKAVIHPKGSGRNVDSRD